jgi:hypothetical protein
MRQYYYEVSAKGLELVFSTREGGAGHHELMAMHRSEQWRIRRKAQGG